MLAVFYVQISTCRVLSLDVIVTSLRTCRILSAVRRHVVYVPVSSELTSGSHGFSWSSLVQVQLAVSLPVYVLKSTVSPLLGLPDPSIAFDWAQFRFGVWGQGAPGRFGAKSHCRAEGSLFGAQVIRNPESPYTHVHPRFKGMTHELGVMLGLLHGRVLGRELQDATELLETLLQIQVSWRSCVDRLGLICSGH